MDENQERADAVRHARALMLEGIALLEQAIRQLEGTEDDDAEATADRLREQVARYGFDYGTAGPADCIEVLTDGETVTIADDADAATMTADRAAWLADRLAEGEPAEDSTTNYETLWALAAEADR